MRQIRLSAPKIARGGEDPVIPESDKSKQNASDTTAAKGRARRNPFEIAKLGPLAAVAMTEPSPPASPSALSESQTPAKSSAEKATPAAGAPPPSADAQQTAAPPPMPAETTKAEGPAPTPSAPDKAAAPPPAAGQPPDKWSRLEKAWKERDRRLAATSAEGWGEIDYAPHLWHAYEELIIYYELQRRTFADDAPGQKPAQAAEKILDGLAGDLEDLQHKLDGAAKSFADSPACRDLQDSNPRKLALRQAVQARNQAIHRAKQFVAWHAQASWGRTEPVFIDSALREFLRKLVAFNGLLGDYAGGPLDGTPQDGHWEKIQTSLQELRKSQQDVEQALEGDRRKLVASTEPATADTMRRMDDMLATPFFSWRQRQALLVALEGGNKEQGAAARKSAHEIRQRWLKSSQERAAKTPSGETCDRLKNQAKEKANSPELWARAREQAEFEGLLLKLAIPDHADEPPPASDLATAMRRASAAGDALVEFYLGLRKDIVTANFADLPSLRSAEIRLRLLPAAVATKIEDKNPVLQLQWSPPEAAGFAFEYDGSTKLVVSSGTWTELNFSLRPKGKFSGKVKIVADKSKRLKVQAGGNADEHAVTDVQTVQLDGDKPVKVTFRLQFAGIQPSDAEPPLVLTATSLATPVAKSVLSVPWKAPPPNDVELIVSLDGQNEEMSKMLVGRASGPSRAATRELRAFPGQITPFIFQLKHQSGKARNLKVELWSIQPADGELQSLRNGFQKDPQRLLKTKPNAFLKLADAVQKDVAGKDVPSLKLEADGRLTPIPFQSPPAPAAQVSAPPPTGTAEARKVPEPPSISDGMICMVSDLDDKNLYWATWIDIRPRPPYEYVQPDVSYRPDNGEIIVALKFCEGKILPPEASMVHVSWDIPGDWNGGKVTKVQTEAQLLVKNAASYIDRPERLRVTQVERDPLKTLEVRLDVDGYPGAFIYHVPLSGVQERRTRRGDEHRIRILSPLPNAAFGINPPRVDRPGDRQIEIPVRIHVDAPDSAFGDGNDSVSLSICRMDDDADSAPEKWSARSARQLHAWLTKADPNGSIEIRATATDFATTLALPPANEHRKLVARLQLSDFPAEVTEVPVVLDDADPVIPSDGIRTIGEARPGEVARFNVTVDDGDGSGVEELQGWIDDEKQPPLTATRNSESGTFMLKWEVKPGSDGSHRLIVKAKDRVGRSSAPRTYEFDVVPKMPDKPATATKPVKGSIKGRVVYGTSAVEKAAITLKGAAQRKATSGANGEFEFKDLPPGDYTLESEGTARNSLRKGSATATVPDPPKKQPVPVTINLG